MSGRSDLQKNFVLYQTPTGNARRLRMPDVDQFMGTGRFLSQFSLMLESEEDLSMQEASLNPLSTGNGTITHHQLINC
jgi:hypothetical protein